jgi:four helix bundle protein
MLKHKITKHKQSSMTENPNAKHYDLEDRTYRFALGCRNFVKKIPRTISSIEYGKQLIRSSGSQAANYIEANEAITKKEFVYRVRMCRKESKESCLWLRLIDLNGISELTSEQGALINEAVELRNIFSSIISKSS